MTVRDLVAGFYGALDGHDLDALDAMVAGDLVYHGLPGRGDLPALKEVLGAFYAGFPDLVHEIEEIVVEGSLAAVRTTTRGTHLGAFLGHPPSRRRFAAPAQAMFRIEDGLIREVWETFDTIGMLGQLGLYRPLPSSEAARRGSRLPPGPRAELTLAEVRRDALAFLQGLVAEHGDHVRYICEGRETVLLNRPEAMRHVLEDRAAIYTKSGTPDLSLLRPMLGDGLLTTVGSAWKEDRDALQGAFSARALGDAAPLMVEGAERMLIRWSGRPDPDMPLDLVPEMSRTALEIAARVLYSTDLSGQSDALRRAMDVLNESMADPRAAGGGVGGRFDEAVALIRRTVRQVLLARELYETDEDDVLTALLRARHERGWDMPRLIDQTVTVLLAGHETTGMALSWVAALLGCHARAHARVIAELDLALAGRRPERDDLRRLPYTRAVIDETLRLYPPVWLLSRTALEEDELDGFRIPAGALVAISPYLLHRHPELWTDPAEFRPERFLSDDGSRSRTVPFGHGPRHCIGRFFATLEMPLVLATVYSQFELALVRPRLPAPEALVTLRPRGGLPVVVRPRASEASAAFNGRANVEAAP
jgi:steroid delta-isomerase-like uncharacterized protein